ncbi:YqaA family protein [Vibrio aphrogenes]|uniref:YqaA family protein n=1 Tax=Vibrio aphrogenes TaxID=1891186 RepID=UPI001E34D8C1|nr:YqaA family protein [Vibrio aphrogenes]
MSEFYFALQQYFVGHPLWFLFFSGFLSATLLPGSSELSLYAALELNTISFFWVMSIATLGNTLGGMTNYYLGLFLPNKTLRHRRGHQLESWIQHYGYWVLLMSWMPIIGDPLCVAAGWLRMNPWLCSLAIFLGKGLRYIALGMIFKGLM